MKRILKIIAAVLCLLLLLGGCTKMLPVLGALINPQEEDNGGLTTFSEIVYERPDMDAITAQFEKAVAMHSDGSKLGALVDQLELCWETYVSFYTMDTVAEIRSYLDVTDSYYAQETAFCLNAEAQIEQLFEQLEIASANCEQAEKLELMFWGEGLIDAYGGMEEGTFDDTYVELFRAEGELLTEYRSVLAAATVLYNGKETVYQTLVGDKTLTDAELEQIDMLYYDKYSEILGEIYIDLVGVRQELASYLGYESYEDYAYTWVYERDYTPAQADMLLQDIRTWIAPLYRTAEKRGMWDTDDYSEQDELKTQRTMSALAQALGGQIKESYDYMIEYGLFDIAISDKKATISYQTYLEQYKAPFVLVKTYGNVDDSLTYAHEFGHFVDSYVNSNMTHSLELTEVFSQSMEYLLLGNGSSEASDELTKIKLLDTLDTYAQQASFAEFEHRVYAIPAQELTVEKLNEVSLQTSQEYGYAKQGMDDYYAKSWIDIPHFFEYPFYVISYCVSNDAALQIYQLELGQAGAGLEQFNRLLPRDYDGFLESLAQQSDLESPFAPDRMKKTAQTLQTILFG